MTTFHPAADSEGDAIRASNDPTTGHERLSGESNSGEIRTGLTRREARALERAAALAAEAEPASAGSAIDEASVVVLPTIVAPVDGPAASEAPAGRRELRSAERGTRRPVRRLAPAAEASVPVAKAGRPVRRAGSSAPATATSSAARRTAALAKGPATRRTAAQRTTRWGIGAAMLFVGATIVSTSVPANAYFVDTPEHVAVKLAAAVQSGTTVGGQAVTGGQKFVASGAVAAEDLDRDGYSVTAKTQPIKNTSSSTFTNDSSAAVQWPFAVGVPISSGFGSRQVANCGFCSTFHEGLDFVPGAGSPIQIIADGTVSKVDQGSGALGYNVWIEHTIGGKKVTSVYAHMIAGSIKVTEGQQVKVGQLVGLVGSTGNSTGAHLHFEIHIDGVPVDPYPWLVANAGAA